MPYTPDEIINCSCNRQVLKIYHEHHMKGGEHTRLLNTPVDDRVLDPLITLGGERFNLCSTCQSYIHHKIYNKHITPKCNLDNPILRFKGNINCICGQLIVRAENYIKHLDSKTHISEVGDWRLYRKYYNLHYTIITNLP